VLAITKCRFPVAAIRSGGGRALRPAIAANLAFCRAGIQPIVGNRLGLARPISEPGRVESLDLSQNSPTQRRLAAILAADIKGFSLMMGQDEDGTVARVTRQLSHLADAVVKTHHGHIFKTVGDGFLALFNSPLDAVRCALAFQMSIVEQNALLPAAQRLHYRIGINLGDVIASGDDFYGDAINIAARTQTAAQAGGICISGSVYEQVKNKLACAYVSLGEERFKNIADPVPIYRVAMDAVPARPRSRLWLFAAGAVGAIVLAAAATGWMTWTGRWSWPTTAAVGAGPGAEQHREAAFKRMISVMQDNRFNWRTVERLAIDAGITEGEAHEILAAHPNQVILGKSREGKLIARLSEN
jgi:class 3 adenylate cyclase